MGRRRSSIPLPRAARGDLPGTPKRTEKKRTLAPYELPSTSWSRPDAFARRPRQRDRPAYRSSGPARCGRRSTQPACERERVRNHNFDHLVDPTEATPALITSGTGARATISHLSSLPLSRPAEIFAVSSSGPEHHEPTDAPGSAGQPELSLAPSGRAHWVTDERVWRSLPSTRQILELPPWSWQFGSTRAPSSFTGENLPAGRDGATGRCQPLTSGGLAGASHRALTAESASTRVRDRITPCAARQPLEASSAQVRVMLALPSTRTGYRHAANVSPLPQAGNLLHS